MTWQQRTSTLSNNNYLATKCFQWLINVAKISIQMWTFSCTCLFDAQLMIFAKQEIDKKHRWVLWHVKGQNNLNHQEMITNTYEVSKCMHEGHNLTLFISRADTSSHTQLRRGALESPYQLFHAFKIKIIWSSIYIISCSKITQHCSRNWQKQALSVCC